jgi:hypothetical protein
LNANARPAVPAAAQLQPTVEVWPAGKPLVRIYQRDFGPRGFNSTLGYARFRPVLDPAGEVVPTAYAGADAETAFAEVLLRGVDALSRGTQPRLYLRDVLAKDLVTLVLTRDLPLARLHGPPLTRLGLTRAQIIDADPPDYPYTAEWAQAIYDCPTEVAGIAWTSRQNDSERAAILWQGPVDPEADLEQLGEIVALDSEPGLDLVRQACVFSGFAFEG